MRRGHGASATLTARCVYGVAIMLHGSERLPMTCVACADSVGTAGGFAARGGAIGDVYVGVSVMNHDRRIQIPVLACTPSVRCCLSRQLD